MQKKPPSFIRKIDANLLIQNVMSGSHKKQKKTLLIFFHTLLYHYTLIKILLCYFIQP